MNEKLYTKCMNCSHAGIECQSCDGVGYIEYGPTTEQIDTLINETGIYIRDRIDWDALELPLDPNIKDIVVLLNEYGIETFESCQGGPGHSYYEPAVRFYGNRSAGFKALDIALTHGLPVTELRRYWSIQDGEPVGPEWEMTFYLGQEYEDQHTEDSIHVGKPASEQVGYVYESRYQKA